MREQSPVSKKPENKWILVNIQKFEETPPNTQTHVQK